MKGILKGSLAAIVLATGVEAISCSEATRPFEQGLGCTLQDTTLVSVNDQRSLRFEAESSTYYVRILHVRPEPEDVPNPSAHIVSMLVNNSRYVSGLLSNGQDIDRLYLRGETTSTEPTGGDEAILDITYARGRIPPSEGAERGTVGLRFIRCR